MLYTPTPPTVFKRPIIYLSNWLPITPKKILGVRGRLSFKESASALRLNETGSIFTNLYERIENIMRLAKSCPQISPITPMRKYATMKRDKRTPSKLSSMVYHTKDFAFSVFLKYVR